MKDIKTYIDLKSTTLKNVMIKLIKLKEKEYPVCINNRNNTAQYIVANKQGGVNFALGMEMVFDVITETK